jgi:hypothetical protein
MNKRLATLLSLLAAVTLLSSCASRQAMNVKIHSDPEGSHIIYRVADDYHESDAPWIYLGMTPYQGVTLIDKSAFEDSDTITFKVMRHDYLDQTKKWSGEQFLEEYERQDLLFWAPRLVKD